MKTTNNIITMKTISLLAVVIVLHINTIFAAGNSREANYTVTSSALTGLSTGLAPVSPKEATFEDVADRKAEAPVNVFTVSLLAPVTPVVADFEDEPAANDELLVKSLAPVTPVNADFEDSI